MDPALIISGTNQHGWKSHQDFPCRSCLHASVAKAGPQNIAGQNPGLRNQEFPEVGTCGLYGIPWGSTSVNHTYCGARRM